MRDGRSSARFVDQFLPALILALQLTLHDTALVEQTVEHVAIGVGVRLGELGVDLAAPRLGAQDGGLDAAQAGAPAARLLRGLLGLAGLGGAGGRLGGAAAGLGRLVGATEEACVSRLPVAPGREMVQ